MTHIPITLDQLNNYKGGGPLLMLSEIGVVDPLSTTTAGLSSVTVDLKG